MVSKKITILIFSIILVVIILLSGCTDKIENNTNSEIQILDNITVSEAYDLIQNNTKNENFIILDIWTPDEYESGHIENSIMIDYYSDTFQDEIDELDKNKTYLIYCRTGRRTGLALDIMEELGFFEVYNMLGGITQWQVEGFPVVLN